ncbi:MAG: acyl-CoA thioesterase [Thermotogae bacterium]|nr:acyl-CoA thioesterase [Thermotogota bacterium]
MFRHRIKVRYAETDQMGVVHHSVYAVYFEEARVAYMEHLGFPYHRMEEEGILLPLLELHVRFRKPARFGDTLEVEVKPYVKGARLFVDYAVFRDGEILAEGTTVHAFTDPSLRPMRPPERIRKLFSQTPLSAD